jgi:hypothetical protein
MEKGSDPSVQRIWFNNFHIEHSAAERRVMPLLPGLATRL